MKKKRGWYLRGRSRKQPALIYLLAGPYQTRREAQVWYDGATKLDGLELTCEFVEAKTIDQWQSIGILYTNIYEPGGLLDPRAFEAKSTRVRLTVARIEEALAAGEITEEQIRWLLDTYTPLSPEAVPGPKGTPAQVPAGVPRRNGEY